MTTAQVCLETTSLAFAHLSTVVIAMRCSRMTENLFSWTKCFGTSWGSCWSGTTFYLFTRLGAI